MTIIWCMVPEIWSMTDRSFCHFGPFFALLLPPPLTTQIFFEKIKKNVWRSFYTSVPKFMIIWYTVPEIWRVTDVIYIFHFGLFLPFYPPNSSKNKIKNKMKKRLEVSSFYTRVPKIMITWCTVPEIWCAKDRWTDGRTEKVTYRGRCPT